MAQRPVIVSSGTRHALDTLAGQIKAARLSRRWTQAELAERATISVHTLRRIEAGDPGVAVGTVLEVAVLAGVELFNTDAIGMSVLAERTRDQVALLPQRVRPRAGDKVDDDF